VLVKGLVEKVRLKLRLKSVVLDSMHVYPRGRKSLLSRCCVTAFFAKVSPSLSA